METNLSVICGCTPTLGDFLHHFFPELDTWRHRGARRREQHARPGRTLLPGKLLKQVLRGCEDDDRPTDLPGPQSIATSWDMRLAIDVDERKSHNDGLVRSLQQQVTRDYHRQLAARWWERT